MEGTAKNSRADSSEHSSQNLTFSRRVVCAVGKWFQAVFSKKNDPTGSKASKIWLIFRRAAIWTFALSLGLVACLRWIPPCTSAVMIEEHLERFFSREKRPGIRYRWVDWEDISPYMALAAVAAEDQLFPHHGGFDLESLRKALETHRKGGRLRGASTITQQVAKNLFLWTGRSYLRKGLEAYFTVLLELLWSKKRILEVYLNIAEFGDGVYGVCAASEIYLRKSPAVLTRRDAALFAAVLPNPTRFRVKNPSSYVRQRRHWIQRQMRLLGGVEYLSDL